MVEAPERIWAGDFDHRGCGHCVDGHRRVSTYVEYVRADIAERQLAEAKAELARMRAALLAISRTGGDGQNPSIIARAVLSGSGDGGWRSIETAPKDGTSILAAHDKAAIVVYWQDGQTVDGAPGWSDSETDLDGYFHTYPVFVWQPLPPLPAAPPVEAEGGGK